MLLTKGAVLDMLFSARFELDTQRANLHRLVLYAADTQVPLDRIAAQAKLPIGDIEQILHALAPDRWPKPTAIQPAAEVSA